MKSKIFLGLLFVGVIFVFASSKATSAEASVTVGAEFSNRLSLGATIPVTVWYYFSATISGTVTRISNTDSVYIAVGSAQSRFLSPNDITNRSPYYVTWWTDCTDPTSILEQWTGSFYGLSNVDVTCKTTNGEPAITSISCPTPGSTLSFSWQMTGGGPYNVAKYHLFRSVAPDTNPDNNYIETITTSSSSGSKSWGGMTAGATYYVRVSAESPQGQWSSPYYSNTACQSLTAPPAPTNLQTFNVPSCSDTNYGGSSDNNGNSPNIKNTWTNGSGTTKTSYQLFGNGTLVYSTGDPPPLWTAAWHWNLVPNTLYTWRVSAGNSVGWSTWVSGPSWNVPKCLNPPWTPGYLESTVPSCSDTAYSASFTWQSTGGSLPTKTEFKIGSGGAVTSWAFAKYSHSVSGFQPNTQYSWYVRFGNNEGWSDWNWEHVGDFFGVPLCTLPDLTISSLTTDKSVYLSGVDTTVSVTIQMKNQGGAVTQNSPFTVFGAEPGKSATSLTTCELKTAYANMWWQDAVLPFAAGATKTYSGSFSVPATAGTYLIRSIADWGCLNTESNEDNNVTDITYQVQSVPTNPANLSVFSSCDETNNPQVTFFWTDSANETGYWLDVNNLAWTGPATPFPWGVKTLGANVASFVWSINSQLDSGSILKPTASTTYYWRLKAFNAAGESSHIYPPSSTTPPGTSFMTPNCIDLSATFVVGSWNKQVFRVGETATARVEVKNEGSTSVTVATTLGLWKGQPGEVSLPICPSFPRNPPIVYTKDKNNNDIGVLAAGGLQEVNIIFNVGNAPGYYTAKAYVIPSCSPVDSNWPNNLTGRVAPSIPFNYSVEVDAWFETVAGDVCSNGAISLSAAPPSGRYQSSYVLARTGSDANAKSERWVLNNYSGQCVSANVYAYLAERFLAKAKENPQAASPDCVVPSGVASGLVYCNANARFQGGTAPKGNSVWFIDGNLTIEQDLALATTDTVTFVVKGNITINTNVIRADGIYIAGTVFRDTTNDSSLSGNQLVVNGAIYAKTANLNRKLSATGATCGGNPCTNQTEPAEKIVFDPQYLVKLSDPTANLIGTPAVSWKEVAP